MQRLSATFYIFLLFLILHIGLLNINAAEWGDSYRILEAAQSLQQGNFPSDEKRPPLFSALLSVKPASIDFVLWGRVVILGLSVAFFTLLYKYLQLFDISETAKKVVLMLFTLNPVFLYWSIRIMADMPFALLGLLIFYLLKKESHPVLIGILTGLAVMTRFEGYVLGLALGISFLVAKDFKKLFLFGVGAFGVLVPYWVWRNPLTSSYFEEPAGRTYNLITLVTYISSLIFLFGTVYAPYFIIAGRQHFKDFFSQNKEILVFTVLELILILVWPAAVPRLFVAMLVPLLIPLGVAMVDIRNKNLFLIALGPILFVLTQYLIRLQFLVSDSQLLVAVIGIQGIVGSLLYFGKKKLFFGTMFAGMLVWSVAVIYSQKDVFKPTKEAAVYLAQNFEGKVGYNDVSSVSGWYLPKGVFYNTDMQENKTYEVLLENDIDYLLVTNEHNPTMQFDVQKRDYLELVKEFRYNIQGTEFWAKVIKVNK